MTEIISGLLSSPLPTGKEQPARSFLYEEFGLSLYEGNVPLSYTGDKGEEEQYNTYSTNNIDSSLFLAEGNWCSSFTDFGLFPNSFENEFLSDTPTSSFPPTPISSNGSDPLSPLSPEDQQEINDIVSSFETPLAQPYNTETSFVSPSSFILPSSTLPTPPPPLGKRSCTDVSSRSSSKRTSSSKASLTSRKERKKEQNKTAALRYRQKKRNELDLLLKQEEELETTNKQLKDQVESLTTEITYLKNLWSEVCKAKAQ